MTKKTLVDSQQLIRATEEYVNQWSGSYKLLYRERDKWGDTDKRRWKSAKAVVYSRLRAQNKEKNKNFWIHTFNNGCIDDFLKKYGLRRYGNRIVFYDCGSFLFKQYLESVVLPAFESELNITGVKLRTKRVSGMSQDLFDWEKAEIKEGGQLDKDSN